MEKYSTAQLQQSLIDLRPMCHREANAAFEMTFDELHSRMGDDAFDEFLDQQGW